MQNFIAMQPHIEQLRKRNALLVTLGSGVSLLVLFIWLKWPIPTIPPPVVEEYIEVNLGNSDVGSGSDQPQIPGAPAAGPQSSATASQQTSSAPSQQDARAVETDDHAPSDVPSVRNPTVSNPNSNRVNETNTKPVKAPPAPAAPRAVFNGVRTPNGTGPGGNGADTYKPGTGEGPGNGPGDAGSVGGSPNGKVYRNDRQVIREYYFQSDLPPATVKAELLIDKNGKASLRQITNGSMARYRNAILNYLPVMTFNKSDHESVIVYTFNFRTSGGQ